MSWQVDLPSLSFFFSFRCMPMPLPCVCVCVCSNGNWKTPFSTALRSGGDGRKLTYDRFRLASPGQDQARPGCSERVSEWVRERERVNGSVFRGTVTGSLSLYSPLEQRSMWGICTYPGALLRGQELNEPRQQFWQRWFSFVSRIIAA